MFEKPTHPSGLPALGLGGLGELATFQPARLA